MTPKVQALIAIIGLSLIVGWFFATHERVASTEYTGYQGPARYNSFLAAELLLGELDIEAASRSSATPSEWLPDPSDTLVTKATPILAGRDQRDFVNEWIRSGGHIVLFPPDETTRIVDEFFSQFGYNLVPADDSGDGFTDDPVESEPDDETAFEYTVDLADTKFRIVADDDASQLSSIGDDIGNIAMRRQYGDGYVTVIADARYFSNPRLTDSDHARLLLDVVAGYIAPGKVWFIYDSAFPPLWQLIWRHAPYAVLSAALLLLMSLWSAIPAFGPRVAPDSAARRSIVEHVSAAGHFSWRNGGGENLVRSSVVALLDDAELRHPGISHLPMAKQATLIAHLTDLNPQTVMDTISDVGDDRQRDFTNHMITIQDIRKRL